MKIGADNSEIARTWADVSYATHEDMKSHTGGIFSMGYGIAHHKSTKQKLNTKSSTEAELVGASDYIAYTVWMKRFMEEQGYKLNSNIFYQDNESAIKMEKNGRDSAGNRSRHINIRYFFIKDILRREGITVQHCPTERMVADFLTKPVQGTLFKTFRDIIMGIKPFPMEERVEKVRISIGKDDDKRGYQKGGENKENSTRGDTEKRGNVSDKRGRTKKDNLVRTTTRKIIKNSSYGTYIPKDIRQDVNKETGRSGSMKDKIFRDVIGPERTKNKNMQYVGTQGVSLKYVET